MRTEEFEKELEERRQYQIDNIGGFYKVFPIEDKAESLSGGLFKNSISKKAKSYYSKFERNGNVLIAQNILNNVVKQRAKPEAVQVVPQVQQLNVPQPHVANQQVNALIQSQMHAHPQQQV